ncbi:MAG: hypothetical protein ACJ757_08560 [Gaiellaceae bacterium]
MSTPDNGGSPSGLTQAQIEAALKRLARQGVKIRWIYQSVGDTLLYLTCVDHAVAVDDPDRDASAKRLIKVLEEIVRKIKRADYRLLLQVVYGLDPEYLRLTAYGRRNYLTTNLYPDEEPLKEDTIRRNHQPKAIRLLAKLLFAHEEEYAAAIADGDPVDFEGGIIHLPGQRASVSGRFKACDEHGNHLARQMTLQAGQPYPPVSARNGEVGWVAL